MHTVQLGIENPIAIRYPRGKGVLFDWKVPFSEIAIGKGQLIKQGSKIAVISIGHIGNKIIDICKTIQNSNDIAHYDMRFVKPLDQDLLHTICKKFDIIVTIEDGTITGGFGSAVLEFIQENNYQNKKVKRLGIPDYFIEHGSNDTLLNSIALDRKSIKEVLESFR